MFSLSKNLIVIFLLTLSSLVQAAEILVLVPGKYILYSGDPERCPNFTLRKEDLKRENLMLGLSYFDKKSASLTMKSDLDPQCNHSARTERTDDHGGKKTVLKNILEEICSGKLKKHSEATATITAGQIQIQYRPDNAQPYVCKWTKK